MKIISLCPLMIKLSGIGKRRLLKSFFRGLNSPYQLKISNTENSEEILNIDLTKKSVYLMLSSFLVGTFLLLSCLFLFTPIKYYIPGFETNSSRKKILKLSAQIDSLNNYSKGKDAYITNLMMIANGNESYLLDTMMLDENELLTSEIRNSGQIDNANKYKHLIAASKLASLAAKNKDTTLQKTNSKTVLSDTNNNKRTQSLPVIKKRDTIIIRN